MGKTKTMSIQTETKSSWYGVTEPAKPDLAADLAEATAAIDRLRTELASVVEANRRLAAEIETLKSERNRLSKATKPKAGQ